MRALCMATVASSFQVGARLEVRTDFDRILLAHLPSCEQRPVFQRRADAKTRASTSWTVPLRATFSLGVEIRSARADSRPAPLPGQRRRVTREVACTDRYAASKAAGARGNQQHTSRTGSSLRTRHTFAP